MAFELVLLFAGGVLTIRVLIGVLAGAESDLMEAHFLVKNWGEK